MKKTTRRSSHAAKRANEFEQASVQEAELLLTTIDRLSHHIATLMQEAHGGSWGVQIEHDVGFVAVVKRFSDLDKRITEIDLREAV